MIHYQLRCAGTHEFDGWFKDSANFERQAKRGLIACPVCASTKVDRALMAPRLAKKSRSPQPHLAAEAHAGMQIQGVQAGIGSGGGLKVEPPDGYAALKAMPEPAGLQATSGALPDQVRAVLHKLRAEVEKNCDYVGPQFAEEARRIHYGESPARGIYGESSESEAEALADEGINITQIPWLPRADS